MQLGCGAVGILCVERLLVRGGRDGGWSVADVEPGGRVGYRQTETRMSHDSPLSLISKLCMTALCDLQREVSLFLPDLDVGNQACHLIVLGNTLRLQLLLIPVTTACVAVDGGS